MSTARKPKPQASKPANVGFNIQFADVPITEANKGAILELSENPVLLFEAVNDAMAEGYSVKLSLKSEEGTYTASITGTSEHDTDANICVSGRSGSLQRALASALYKVGHIARFGLIDYVNKKANNHDL